MTDSTQLFPPFAEETLPGGGHRSLRPQARPIAAPHRPARRRQRQPDCCSTPTRRANGSTCPTRSSASTPPSSPPATACTRTWAACWPPSCATPAAGTTASAACSCAEKCARKYGAGRYQELRNGFYRNGAGQPAGRDGQVGPGPIQDLLMTLNLFSRVDVDDAGRVPLRARATRRPATTSSSTRRWTRWWCSPPSSIRWTRRRDYAPKPVRWQLDERRRQRRRTSAALSRAENQRGFINTDRLLPVRIAAMSLQSLTVRQATQTTARSTAPPSPPASPG